MKQLKPGCLRRIQAHGIQRSASNTADFISWHTAATFLDSLFLITCVYS